jgi:hypothetical protein
VLTCRDARSLELASFPRRFLDPHAHAAGRVVWFRTVVRYEILGTDRLWAVVVSLSRQLVDVAGHSMDAVASAAALAARDLWNDFEVGQIVSPPDPGLNAVPALVDPVGLGRRVHIWSQAADS